MATLHFEFEKYDMTFELEAEYTVDIMQSIGDRPTISINIDCAPITCTRGYDGNHNKAQDWEIKQVLQRDNIEIARKAHRLILEKVEI